jgi:hypothetical protein
MAGYVLNGTHVKYNSNGLTTIDFDWDDDEAPLHNDDFITLLDPSNQGDFPLLLGKGYIKKINISRLQAPSKLAKPQKTKYHYRIISDSFESYKKYNELDDYAYSLQRIFRYQNPERQFRRTFTALETEDVVTLEKEWIFISRTILGRLINALPRLNKLEFVSQAILEFNTDDLRKVSYTKGLRFLKDYIEEEILAKGRYLTSTRDLLENTLKQVVGKEDLGFLLENEKTESIATQALLFDRVFALESTFKTLETNLVRAQEMNVNSELHFARVFRGNRWPIDLNKDE